MAAVVIGGFVVYAAFALWRRRQAIAAGRRTIGRGGLLADRLPYFIPIPYLVVALRPGPELALPDGVRWAGLAISCAGIAVAVWAAATLGRHFDLEVEVHEGHEVVDRGPYALVRHPVYSGLALHFVGASLATGNLLFIAGTVLISFPAFRLRASAEERLLSGRLGPAYAAYARRVPMLIPRIPHPG